MRRNAKTRWAMLVASGILLCQVRAAEEKQGTNVAPSVTILGQPTLLAPGRIASVDIDVNRPWLVLGCQRDNNRKGQGGIAIWDMTTLRQVSFFPLGDVYAVHCMAHGDILASARVEDASIGIRDPKSRLIRLDSSTGKVRWFVSAEVDEIGPLSVSPDEKTVVAPLYKSGGTVDDPSRHKMLVVDAEKGDVITTLDHPAWKNGGFSLAGGFSEDGCEYLTAGSTNKVKTGNYSYASGPEMLFTWWNTKTWTILHEQSHIVSNGVNSIRSFSNLWLICSYGVQLLQDDRLRPFDGCFPGIPEITLKNRLCGGWNIATLSLMTQTGRVSLDAPVTTLVSRHGYLAA